MKNMAAKVRPYDRMTEYSGNSCTSATVSTTEATEANCHNETILIMQEYIVDILYIWDKDSKRSQQMQFSGYTRSSKVRQQYIQK